MILIFIKSKKSNLFLSIILIAFTFFSCNSRDDNTEEIIDDEVIDDDAMFYQAESFVKIENGLGGLDADLDAGDRFGRDHDVIGDVDGDGVIDYVIGARSDDDGGVDAGAVYILFMNSDGSVSSNQKISTEEGDFDETLNAGNFFGYGVAGVGDYNDDGIPDIAVSAPTSPNNSLYIIHLDTNGKVKSYVKNENISAQGLTAIGDINNDNRIDLVACDPRSDDGGSNRGAIDILFLNDSSEVLNESTVTISSTQGNFGEGLQDGDEFGGREVAMLGDLDNDGTIEMAVGAFLSDGGKGAIWILSLDATTLNVVSKIKITEGLNGFTETLDLEENPNGTFGAQFGHAMCAAGDIDGDGITDLVTGANQQNEGNGYILYLNADKTVRTFDKISATEGGFDLVLGTEDRFARSISYVGDIKGDGSFAVNFGGGVGIGGTGSLYTLFFRPIE
ncbi:integrin alpha [Algibacter sp. L1A34]|uniref:integrin alpha n=1 Tax=Algibacter sp. L1A34 TaxID=2686365 RepID=UPI0018EF048C|nr:integrin alpha [Algibacter sp. L1A34]